MNCLTSITWGIPAKIFEKNPDSLQIEINSLILDRITMVVKGLGGRVVTIVGFLPKVYPSTRF